MRIVLAGYFGFSNLGDDLLAATAVRTAQRRFPVLKLTVLSRSPLTTAARFGVESVPMFDLLSVASAIARADRLVFAGGGVFQDDTSRSSLLYYLGLMTIARFFRKPVGLANVGVDPISSSMLRRMFRRLWRSPGVTATVRDESSRLAAVGAGVSAERLAVTADGVFAVPSTPAAAVERPLLLVVRVPPAGVTDRLPALFLRSAEHAGLATAVAAVQPGDDETMARSLGRGGGRAALPTLDEKTAADVIGASARVISGRYHALVLAALAGRPFLGFGDPGKIRALCAQFSMPYLPWDAPEGAVGEAFAALMAAQTPDPAILAPQRGRAKAGFAAAFGVPPEPAAL